MLTKQIVLSPAPPQRLHAPRSALATSTVPPADRHGQFLRMLAAYRRSSGLKPAHDVGIWLEGHRVHPVGTLNRWMAHNDVIHLEWQHQTWLPMFQFDLVTMAPRVAVGLVLIEFGSVIPNWDIAQWFATPNSALDAQTPSDSLNSNPAGVMDAARQETRLWAHRDL